jgi:hypothetical protein
MSQQLLPWAEFKGQVKASDLHIKQALKRLRLKPAPSPADTSVGLYDPAWVQVVGAWIDRHPARG